jgi:mono/diheme cytochrome c family protein
VRFTQQLMVLSLVNAGRDQLWRTDSGRRGTAGRHRKETEMKTTPLLAVLALAAAPALAQETDTATLEAGQAEYMAACAACHGEAADGNGPIATMFRDPVPNLTGLAARNDGQFPMLDVIHIIDGRADVRAHGNPMPVFGARYARDVGTTAGDYGAEQQIRGRVLSLALYLASIQEG